MTSFKVGGILGIRNGFDDVIKKTLDFNMECLDLFLPVWQTVVKKSDIQNIKNNINIPLTFHYKTSTILSDSSVYELIRDQIMYYLELSDELDIPIITIHVPSTRRLKKKTTFNFEDERWFHRSLDYGVSEDFFKTRQDLIKLLFYIKPFLEKTKTVIAIENTDRNARDFSKRIEELKEIYEIVREVKSDQIQMCFDVYKAYTTGEHLDIDTYNKHIVQIQLSDYSVEKGKGHIVLGNGDIPLSKILQLFQSNDYNGHYIVEVPEEYMKDSIEYVRKQS